MKTIKVVAAVIKNEDKIFATQRGYGEFKDGWEFPGGKIEAGETPQQALKREIREELDTVIEVGKHIDTIEYDYPTFHLSMQKPVSSICSITWPKTLGSPSNCMFSAASRSGNETPITLSIPTRRKPLNGTRQSRRCFPNRTLIRKNLCGTTAEHCANAMKVLSNTRKRTDWTSRLRYRLRTLGFF